jgi:hypothetical protein
LFVVVGMIPMALGACGGNRDVGWECSPHLGEEIARVEAVWPALDDFHDAAANADEERYFKHFARHAVYMGPGAGERWMVDAYRARVHPLLAAGKGWKDVGHDRHITLADSGDLAYFDERVDSEEFGACRGSGVMVYQGNRPGEWNTDGEWKISQYELSVLRPWGTGAP